MKPRHGRPGNEKRKARQDRTLDGPTYPLTAAAARPRPGGTTRTARPDIRILHADEDVVAIDKPSGLPCVPERHGRGETVLSVLARDLQPPLRQELRLVHRLDRDTSGVMVLARIAEAQRSLTTQFMQRTVAKTYLALVLGSPEQPSGRVDAPIGELRGDAVRVCYNPRRGKAAVTEWETVERFNGYTLVRCRPRTGRQHQVRLHMQLAGLPLAVDPLYGGREGLRLSSFKPDYRASRSHEERPLIGRLTLHAESIELEHPRTGQRIRWEAALPRDFRATLNQLRKHCLLPGNSGS